MSEGNERSNADGHSLYNYKTEYANSRVNSIQKEKFFWLYERDYSHKWGDIITPIDVEWNAAH